MRTILPLFTIAYAVVAGLLGIAALVLMGFAFLELWAVGDPTGRAELCLLGRRWRLRALRLVAVALVAWRWRKLWRREEVRETRAGERAHSRPPVSLSVSRRRGSGSRGRELLRQGLSCRHSTSGPRCFRTPQASPWARRPSWRRGGCSSE